MNREIKFRAWDKHCKYHIYFGGRPMFDDDQNTVTFQCDKVMGDHDDDGDRFILMQYTGLKDKNGKEIYEGDIVKMYVGEKSRIVGSVTYGGWQYSVTMKVAGKDKTNYFGYNSEDIELDKLEIIGNIYENPDLLNNGLQTKN